MITAKETGMKIQFKLISGLLTIALAACSDSEQQTDVSQQSKLLETQTKALEDTKKMESLLQENADRRKEQMEQEGI
ncbi:hypothetical protein [Methylotuvimicrobium alcaliphilum]|uniref:hypothetical protein n=1 Tax=Methylotuvimicrobium alcaliphilum TaxID=271065 RepID=UPI0002E95443|nr:hypothetical protein [Methylotuvimicrobium alcaliphilum]